MRVVGWRLWSIVLLCWLLLLWRVVLLLLLQLTPRGRVLLLLLVFGRGAAEGAESGEVVLDQRPGGGPQLGLVHRHGLLRLVELLVQLLLLQLCLIQLLLLQLVVQLAPQHVLLHLVRDVL